MADEDLIMKGEGDRIARLLDDVRGMAGPSTWARVEELVQRLVRLHGAGLERVLAHAGEAGADGGALGARLADDELVSSLLLLHGLHPLPPAERLARAVEALRAQLAPQATLELVGLGEDGVVSVRLAFAPGGCPSTGRALAAAVEQRLLEAAPEVAGVRVEGAGAEASPPRPQERLVTLGRPQAAGVSTP
jgi:Fe-S cluster biogenesis protein NfuA